nr:ABC transporter ATP-binding protein [Candidatus Sigynarchaeota archaeon]
MNDGIIFSELKVENLSFSYNGVRVLENIEFSAKKGNITTIMGPNGCGKTTLFKALDFLLPVSSGRISLDGRTNLVGL